jgi:hypothetical protein
MLRVQKLASFNLSYQTSKSAYHSQSYANSSEKLPHFFGFVATLHVYYYSLQGPKNQN